MVMTSSFSRGGLRSHVAPRSDTEEKDERSKPWYSVPVCVLRQAVRNMKMSMGKLILVVILWLTISKSSSGAETKEEVPDDGFPSSNSCQNCSICPYSCHSLPPPSPSGYPSYGAPPPPELATPVQGNCPPSPPVQCCQQQQHPPPAPYGYGYTPYEDNMSSSIHLRFSDRPLKSVFVISFIFFIFFFVVLL